MTDKTGPLTDVPTNVITGFLGVGKTTAILNLLENKPEGERWAVLVNEFGEIGVDGSLIEGQQREEYQNEGRQNDDNKGDTQQVYVQEVPGGCMCCAAGLPMQVALNALLVKSRPDRVLIEPTGLGHPKEVLQVLSTGSYRKILDVQQTITLVDARQLGDQRYADNEIFKQQIEVADVVVANKADLYDPQDKKNLHHYVRKNISGSPDIVFSSYGKIDTSLLSGKAGFRKPPAAKNTDHHDHGHNHSHDHNHHHEQDSQAAVSTGSLPVGGFIKKLNEGEGFYSAGWRFHEDTIFARSKLFTLLSGINATRVKAVINTNEGPYGYNVVAGSLTEVQLFSRGQSCIEIIGDKVDDEWQAQLLECLKDAPVSRDNAV